MYKTFTCFTVIDTDEDNMLGAMVAPEVGLAVSDTSTLVGGAEETIVGTHEGPLVGATEL